MGSGRKNQNKQNQSKVSATTAESTVEQDQITTSTTDEGVAENTSPETEQLDSTDDVGELGSTEGGDSGDENGTIESNAAELDGSDLGEGGEIDDETENGSQESGADIKAGDDEPEVKVANHNRGETPSVLVVDEAAELPVLSIKMQRVKDLMEEYITVMNPTRPTEMVEIVKMQKKFMMAINIVMGLRGEEFESGMDMLVSIIRTKRTSVFGELTVFRGFSTMTIADNARQFHIGFVNLLLSTADCKRRDDVSKIVSLELIYNLIDNGEVRETLEEYYS